jgi:hypothetical protein
VTEVLYTVIGDLVGSRDVPDRAALQTALGETLAAVNQHIAPRQPFEATVGDEFQGACLTLADAARAALLVRLGLLPTGDTRCGLGHGEVTVHDASRRPLLQDGPGWWAARDAIEVVAGTRTHRRTSFVGPDSGPVNAFLTCRDQLVERLNERGLRILRLALLGHAQKEIAEIEQVTRSAVSQQFSRGVGAIVDAHAMLDHHGGAP